MTLEPLEVAKGSAAWSVGEQKPAATDKKGTATEAAAKAVADAKALSEKNGRLSEMKYGSPEWVALARELGHGADENQGEGQGDE